MALQRYNILDPYTIEELRIEYFGSDYKNRIRLLKRLQKDSPSLHIEIIEWAVKDENAKVRRWIAKNGKFNTIDEPDEFIKILEREDNLFIRASLLENPTVNFDFVDLLPKISHMERLALLRNPKLGKILEYEDELRTMILSIFDYHDLKIKMDAEERCELILAILSNENVWKKGEELKTEYEENSFFDGLSWYLTGLGAKELNVFYSKIWDLVTKWPREHHIQMHIFNHVQASDETKARALKEYADDFMLKMDILRSCDSTYKRVIEAAKNDSDDQIKAMAYSLVQDLNDEQVNQLIDTNDVGILDGLADNESLSIKQLYKIHDRLANISDYDSPARRDRGELIRKKSI